MPTMFSIRYFLVVTLFFMSSVIAGQSALVFDCTQHSQDLLSYMKDVPLFITDIQVECDVVLDSSEINYLLDIQADSLVDQKKMAAGLFYLRQKNCFKSIIVHLKKQQEGRYSVLFDLVMDNIFIDLSFKGVLHGKDALRQLYLLEPGDRYEEEKHAASLHRIEQYFMDLGYLDVQVVPRVLIQNKRVKVKLEIKKGVRFAVSSTRVDYKEAHSVYQQDQELELLIKKLHKMHIFPAMYSKPAVERASELLKKQLEEKGFAHIDIHYTYTVDNTTSSVSLLFEVCFFKKKKFIFFGNHFFNRQELLDTLLAYGKSSWHFPTTILEDELKQLYAKKGFWSAHVKVSEERARLFCVIDEGKRATIKEIICKNNEQMSTADIIKIFKKKLLKKYVDQDKIEQIIDEVLALYAQRGYWQAKVVKKEYVVLKDQEYALMLVFDEGPLKKLSRIEVVDHPDIFIKSPYEALTNLKEPIIFNQELIAQMRSWILSWFKKLGYIRLTISYEIVNQDEGDLLRFIVTLDDAAAVFGKTVVQGYSMVPFYYLKKELAYRQHEQWRSKQVQKTIYNIKEFGVFDTIEAHPVQEVDPYDEVPVALRLIQAPTYEVRTRIGVEQIGRDFSFSDGFSYKAGGTFVVNNPLKIADQFSLNGDFTRFYRNLSVKYSMPWIGHLFRRSLVKLYDNYYNQPLYIGSKKTMYIATQTGCLFSLQDTFKGFNVALNGGIDVLGMKSADIKSIEKYIDYDATLMDHKQLYFVLEPTVMIDAVDNVMMPSKGYRSFLSLKGMIDVQAKSSFFKMTLEHSYYTKVFKIMVLAVRMRLGHIFNSTFNKIHPIERFYLGGANSVRGYERDYCPPLGLLADPIAVDRGGLPDAAHGYWRYVPQGGKTMINANLELRFPMYKALDGVVFTDLGCLIKERLAKVSDGLLAASGFGLRYNTPIGPIRFDIGWKWKRQYADFESSYGWYLTFGHSF